MLLAEGKGVVELIIKGPPSINVVSTKLATQSCEEPRGVPRGSTVFVRTIRWIPGVAKDFWYSTAYFSRRIVTIVCGVESVDNTEGRAIIDTYCIESPGGPSEPKVVELYSWY